MDDQRTGILLRVREVATRLRASERTVQMLCEAGQLKAFKVGRGWRVWERDLEQYIADQEAKDPQ